MSENIFWILEANINDGQLDNLKALMREMVDATERDEPGALNYEWFIADDSKSLHLFERYADPAAVMVHLGNFGQKFAERFTTYLTTTKLTVYGNPSAELRQAAAGFAPIYMRPLAGFAHKSSLQTA